MKVFLDECVDWRLARHLPRREVRTARRMGWTAITNGELLSLASGEFDAFVTVDRNLAFQQNTNEHAIALFVCVHPRTASRT